MLLLPHFLPKSTALVDHSHVELPIEEKIVAFGRWVCRRGENQLARASQATSAQMEQAIIAGMQKAELRHVNALLRRVARSFKVATNSPSESDKPSFNP